MLVPEVSQREINIQYGFTGAELLLFGAIVYPDARSAARGADIVVVLKSPVRPVTVREKQKVAGIWINADSTRFRSAPALLCCRFLAADLRYHRRQDRRNLRTRAGLSPAFPDRVDRPGAAEALYLRYGQSGRARGTICAKPEQCNDQQIRIVSGPHRHSCAGAHRRLYCRNIRHTERQSHCRCSAPRSRSENMASKDLSRRWPTISLSCTVFARSRYRSCSAGPQP